MPVSKKRKKDGKPVHMTHAAAHGEEHPHGPDDAVKPPVVAKARPGGKPSNPFVAQQSKRGAQRGR